VIGLLLAPALLLRWRPCQRDRMNAIFSDDYVVLVDLLIEARLAAGLTQRALARRIGKVQSHICAIEQRQRRVELLEFYTIARALGLDPVELFSRAAARFDRLRDPGFHSVEASKVA
jgi:ribosome-binding protein aMBF1 (putative translation factor)